ncbi:MAG: DUF2007 domain-containing protein [Treponema sp.]|nr:DUF2007 domain-containing protein [Treponema sp.]
MIVFAVIIYTLFGAMCVWFVISGVKKINQVKASQSLSDLYTSEEEHDKAIKDTAAFEMNYFERVRNGEQNQQFLIVGAQTWASMIRSILFAEGIPTYAENEHVNSMYSINNSGAASSFSIKIFILVADYDKAKEIVDAFVSKTLSKDSEDRSLFITVLPKTDSRIVREE